jgi:hypothetical protein
LDGAHEAYGESVKKAISEWDICAAIRKISAASTTRLPSAGWRAGDSR